MRLATLQYETKLQKCIRMGITIVKSFIWGGMPLDIQWEITFLRLRSHVAVKLNFRPHIRRYTPQNENFEYSYPLITSRVGKSVDADQMASSEVS